MSPANLGDLRLERERVETVARFNTAYAATCERELVAMFEGGEGAPPTETRWLVQGDAAAALADAAQWKLLVEIESARALAKRAAAHYLELGHAYGLFLMGAYRAGDVPMELVNEAIERMVAGDMSLEGRESREFPLDDSLVHPQQQAYLALSAASSPNLADDHRRMLLDVLRRSAHRHSGAPMGAIGVPLRRYWNVATLLLERDAYVPAIAHLVAMAGRYAERIESAMSNDHLWRHGASPVAIVDLDLVGMAALATRVFGREFTASLVERLALESPLERLVLGIGIELDAPDALYR